MMLAAGERDEFASRLRPCEPASATGRPTLDTPSRRLLGIAPGETFLAIGR